MFYIKIWNAIAAAMLARSALPAVKGLAFCSKERI